MKWRLYGPVDQQTLNVDTTNVPDPEVYNKSDEKIYDYARRNGLLVKNINHAGKTATFEEKPYNEDMI